MAYKSNRISKKDIANSINRPAGKASPIKQTIHVNTIDGILVIGQDGQPLVNPKDSQICARYVKVGTSWKYTFRVNRRDMPYDPHSASYLEESLRLSRLEANEPFRLVECTKGQFDSYVNYLQTKNIKYLNDASRF